MKGLLITAFSLFLFGAAYAQDNGSDDDGITNEKTGLDGSPMPGHEHHHDMHWCDLTTIAISPLQFTQKGVGVGLSYERALDADGIISAYVPFIASFNLRRRYADPYAYTSSYNPYPYNYNYNNSTNPMFYVMPGVKFYPTGMGRVKYAIGPNAVVGMGQQVNDMPIYLYDPMGGTYMSTRRRIENRFLLGMMINNSLNINATPHLYVGAELGFGFTYFDKVGDFNRGSTFLMQGAFKMGYTF